MINYLNQEHLNLVRSVADFFTAEQGNESVFKQIKEKCNAEQLTRSNNDRESVRLGYLNILDYLTFISPSREGEPLETNFRMIELVVDQLVKTNIINKLPNSAGGAMRMRYKANGEFAGFLHKHDLILNYIGGWPFIINKYANAVVKVVPTNIRGEESIGTGFYVTFQEQNAIRHLVVTNRHVVEDKPRVKVCNLSNEEVLHSNIFLDNSRDLAFIELIDALNVPPFYLNDSLEILSEIITIGFPTIPMTKEAYQVCHKGEINSFVETYHGNKMFLFSAKTSSGNSGSPILDRNGMVVGIVSEEFFNYDDLLSKGKPAYYAGIPSSEIIDSATMHVK